MGRYQIALGKPPGPHQELFDGMRVTFSYSFPAYIANDDGFKKNRMFEEADLSVDREKLKWSMDHIGWYLTEISRYWMSYKIENEVMIILKVICKVNYGHNR